MRATFVSAYFIWEATLLNKRSAKSAHLLASPTSHHAPGLGRPRCITWVVFGQHVSWNLWWRLIGAYFALKVFLSFLAELDVWRVLIHSHSGQTRSVAGPRPLILTDSALFCTDWSTGGVTWHNGASRVTASPEDPVLSGGVWKQRALWSNVEHGPAMCRTTQLGLWAHLSGGKASSSHASQS